MTSSTTSRLGKSPEEAVKAPCVVETAIGVNINLTGEQTVNGVAVVAGDRVFVKDQTIASENGIYNVSTTAWTRAKDWNKANDVVSGTLIPSAQSGIVWMVEFTGTFVPGVTEFTAKVAIGVEANAANITDYGATPTQSVEDSLAENRADIAKSLRTVDTLAELKASTAAVGTTLYVKGRTADGDGYAGNFFITSADLSAQAALDPQEACFVTLANGNYAVRTNVTTLYSGWFGVDLDGAPSTTELQAAIDFSFFIASRYRRAELELGAGKITFSSLTVSNPGTETGKTQGRVWIKGAGQINTELVCTSATDDAIKLTSGRCKLTDFSLTSDGVNRSKTIGTGNGIVVDASGGVLPDTVSVAEFELENLQVQQQPVDGCYFVNPELVRTSGVVCSNNGSDGFNYDGANGGGTVLGISDYSVNCRAIQNGGRGLTVTQTSECTFVNFQALENDAVQQVFSNGRNTVLINPDVEAKFGASNDIGIELAGRGSGVLSGLLVGCRTGIKLTGNGQWVTRPHFTNAGIGFAMNQAVDTSSATNYRVELADSDMSSQNVTAVLLPRAVHSGGTQIVGQYSESCIDVGKVETFAVTSNTSFNFGDSGQAGSGVIGSRVYYVDLQSNAVIQVPLTARTGQEFEIVFKQDGTGGRVVTLVGTDWIASFDNTGNVAGARTSLRFRAIFDSALGKVLYVQIGSQLPYV
ncbi:hypothetical protein [Litorivivens sp.]|uniref:hypothetical protein n=1 Tax=Litorivivens sp. TaxID=2020868 RepID=UPI0035663538